ncbi:MAG: membrane protein insertion efficiency factor YidD [Bdellovibrionales bacterium]|nr:membrane protein insertion efficiency factor YidD [Bdellovibrionales bacterium]NQZ17670.1 membrane protein insertion efficiency factor YidD [Bdellovibrionales bacterium]
MNIKKEITSWLFAFYKAALNPFFGNACKFHPSCSCYAKEAFQQHNLFKAFLLTSWRLLRCQPFSRGGFDPVPQAMEKK